MTVGVKDAFTGANLTMEVDTTWLSSSARNPYSGETVSIAGYNRSYDTYKGAGGGGDTLSGTSGRDALLYDTTGSTKVDLNGTPVADAHHFAGIDFFTMGLGDDVLDLTGAGGAGGYDVGGTLRVFGDTGSNAFLGGGAVGGNDVLWLGGGGVDVLCGDADRISGAAGGNDDLHGGGGLDYLYGDARLLANATAGDDVLDGGIGNDILLGDGQTISGTLARGHNTFVFDGPGSGADTIGTDATNGFQHGLDHIRLDPSYGYTAEQALDRTADVGGNAVVDLGNGDRITLAGVLTAQLDASDFVIA